MTTNIIIYDLDGTIANTSKSIIKSFNYAFKKNGLNAINSKFFLKNASRGSHYFIKKNMLKKDYPKIKKINNDFLKFYSINCDKQITLKRGLKWFLKKNKKKYVNIVCTNKKKKFANKILKKLKIDKYFYSVIGSDSFKYNKPSKRLFKFITKNKKLFLKPLIIGDSEIDSQFAKNVKANFVLVENGYTIIKKNLLIQKYSIKNFFQLNEVLKQIYK